MTELVSDEYAALLGAVKARVRAAQYEALKAVNRELVIAWKSKGTSTS